MKTNPNDSAFATQSVYDEMGQNQEQGSYGLTKREYFAAMAMQGICANPTTEIKPYGKEIAVEAVLIADALIEQLNKIDN